MVDILSQRLVMRHKTIKIHYKKHSMDPGTKKPADIKIFFKKIEIFSIKFNLFSQFLKT
jgi:hypothetical protein